MFRRLPGRYLGQRQLPGGIDRPIWPRVQQRGRRGRGHRPPQLEQPQEFIAEVVRQNEQFMYAAGPREINRPPQRPDRNRQRNPQGPVWPAQEQVLLLEEEGEIVRVGIEEVEDLEPAWVPPRVQVLELEGPPILPVDPYFERHKQTFPKDRVMFKGSKRKQTQNCLYKPEDERKPLYIKDSMEHTPTKRTQRLMGDYSWNQLVGRAQNLGPVDMDLVAELWMEAAFQPRTPRLLIQLKNKAKRFMADWDTGKYSRLEIYAEVIRAVGVAMTISPAEEEVRKYLLRSDVNRLVLDHHLFTRGILKAPTFQFNKTLPNATAV